MKSVWAEFLVPDDADADAVAHVLELLFKAPEATAVVTLRQRAMLEMLRVSYPLESGMHAERLAVAESIHLNYDYGSRAVGEGPWQALEDIFTCGVELETDTPEAGIQSVELRVTFEPNTASVADVTISSSSGTCQGRRLDPQLGSSDELLQARLFSAEQAWDRSSCSAATVASTWRQEIRGDHIIFSRSFCLGERSGHFEVSFAAGSSEVIVGAELKAQ